MEITFLDAIVGLFLTWGWGLLIPITLRKFIFRRPTNRVTAALIVAGLWIVNIALFTALGSKSKGHAALFVVAWVSYWVLTTSDFKILHARRERTHVPEGGTDIISVESPILKVPKSQATRHGMNGWQRLWLVLTVASIIPISVYVYRAMPSAANIKHHETFYKQMATASIEALDGKLSALGFTKNVNGEGVELEMPNGHVLSFKAGTSPDTVVAMGQEYMRILEREATRDRMELIEIAGCVWLAASVLAYVSQGLRTRIA